MKHRELSAFDAHLLKYRSCLCARGIEVAAGIPPNSLTRHLLYLDGRATGRRLNPKHIPAVVGVLDKMKFDT